ncbi:MAG: hypothetical protein IJA07_03535 [Agathobacter sp.]|nr:hypothetical protein [Agathobacter sp.]
MKRKLLSLLLVMTMGMTLLVGCGGSGDKDVNNDNGTSVNQNENKDDANVDVAVIADVWTGEKIEISYNKDKCEKMSENEYLLSVSVDSGETLDIEFHADYTASSFYSEDVQAMSGAGLKASELVDYSTAKIKIYGYEYYESASDALYSCTLLHEVDGGVLIVHNTDLGFANKEVANVYAENVFVSAKLTEKESAGSDTNEESSNKLATTNVEKELVYKADYDAIKDKIVNDEKDRNEASYYDANGLEIMYVYYDGENITDVFFKEYNANGIKTHQKVYAFHEDGTYGIMEFEYYENGEKKTETTYKEDGSKIVFSFDENGEYVSATEYDKDGNVIGNN